MKTHQERFWAKVDMRSADECWMWLGGRDRYGYGTFCADGVRHTASHFAYEFQKEPVAHGLCVCHKCDTPLCCNPAHLWVGTHADNIHDRDKKGRTVKGDRHFSRTHPELLNPPLGEEHGNAKLTGKDIQEMKLWRAEGLSNKRIAPLFSISNQHVSRIFTGKAWAHLQLVQ